MPTVDEHLSGIYADGEQDPGATIRRFRIVQTEGSRQVTREVEHYNLSVILAVGFRVRSQRGRGTQFCQWATTRLDEYLVKGFTMDDQRLKNPPGPDVPDYFDELLERIRDIRASERRLYLRVRDILALASDYTPTDAQTQAVFQTVQNKLLFAATGKTAPEIISSRADAQKPNMGLTSWHGDRVLKADVTVSKNYLSEPDPKLQPITEVGSGNVQEREKALLEQIIEKVNDLFEGELTEQDTLVYVNNVIQGKLLESETMRQQAANNSKEQFANSPDLSHEVDSAIMSALDAHTLMSTQALNSRSIRDAIKEVLLNNAGLYEKLRAQLPPVVTE